MAYFDRNTYDRKREYAYNVSSSGIDEIAVAILKKQGITTDDDNFDFELENLVEELQPIADLSHERHEMHSSRDYSDDTSYFDVLGNQFSDDGLLVKVNELNDKYNIVEQKLPNYFEITEIDWEAGYDLKDLCEEYDIDYDDNWEEDSKQYNNAIEEVNIALMEENRRRKDEASKIIRDWFYVINKKYGTNFPS